MSRIIVKNLPSYGLREDEVRKHFTDIDNVTDVQLKYNDFGTFRRFAFISFQSTDAAEKAIEKLNNSFIRNSKIKIESCKAIRDVKPEKIRVDDPDDKNEDVKTLEHNVRKNEFDDVRDDAEFKEFLKLQRNISENADSKMIWADDVQHDIDVDGGVDPSVEEATQIDEKTREQKKRHKRSRPQKKTNKTKPKELFLHSAKISGFPETVRRKDVKDFFKPLEILSIRINKRDGICYVSFKDESDLRFGIRKNLHFWNTSRIRITRHDVKKSRIFKEKVEESVKQKNESFQKYKVSIAETEPIGESGRLFVRNLNYSCKVDDLEELFSKYGEISDIHYPIDKTTSLPKGFAYVEFMFPNDAVKAYEELNGTIFQGRNFHLIPSKPRPESNQNVTWRPNMSKDSAYKMSKLSEQKEMAPKENKDKWNMLFLGQNALADVISDMKSVDKGKLLTEQTSKDPIAVRMALGDAMIVEEMRKFLISNGVELDSFDNPKAPRSKNVMIVKNLPTSINKSELLELFEKYGRVSRIIIPPKGLTAIVEMEEHNDAKLAFKKVAYSKFKDSILYLEWAPVNVFGEKSLDDQELDEQKEMEESQTGTKILVKNVPFEASVGELRKIFAAYGQLNFVRIPKKLDGQHRGFCFVDYLMKDDALRAFRALCHSTHLYGRKLVLEWAKKSDGAETSSKSIGDTIQKQ